MKYNKINRLGLAALVASTLTFSYNIHAADKTIAIDGSSSVYPITEAVAEDFQKKTGTKVTVGVSGTGGGFKKFCRGETVISNASRPISKKEMETCFQNGVTFIELPVAWDALTVVTNKANDWAKSITVAELNKIWASGSSVKNWKDVNPAWPNQPMKLFGPGADSGTFDYFTEAINGRAKSSRSDFTPSEDDNVLVTGVAGDKGGLAYFGLAYYLENKDKLNALAIVAKNKTNAVEPSEATVMDGTYQPLARPLFIYVNGTKGAFDKDVKAFVEYYIANAPKLVKEVKYIPLNTAEYAAVFKHWQSKKSGSGFDGTSEVNLKIEDLIKRIKD
jgi:phosphate transport system substrate-binding protein